MTALPVLGPEHYLLIERLAFDLGRLDRELRGHPLAEAWDLRAMVLAGAAAAEDSGLTLDRGRLFAAAAELPIAVYRNDHGIPTALRHVQLQGAWFAAATAAGAALAGGDLERLLDTGPVAEAMGPWTVRHFGWSTTDLTACIEALGRSQTGLAGLLRASWGWVSSGGDPMALTIAFPLAAAAQRFSARPLPGCSRAAAGSGRRRDGCSWRSPT